MQPFEQRGQAIIKRLPKNGVVAEIGVLTGRVSEYVLRKRSDACMFMVDSWEPSEKQPQRYKDTNDDHSTESASRVNAHKQEARRRVRLYGRRATILHMTSLQASEEIQDNSLDVVFIDADHSYEGVKEDIAAWLPKVKPGGWIGGHDYANPDPRFRFGVTEAVDDFVKASGMKLELDMNFTWWCNHG